MASLGDQRAIARLGIVVLIASSLLIVPTRPIRAEDPDESWEITEEELLELTGEKIEESDPPDSESGESETSNEKPDEPVVRAEESPDEPASPPDEEPAEADEELVTPPELTGVTVDDDTEVIIVQAQRRDQDLQKVPEAVSSFSAQDLLDRGLVDFNDLQFNVPNLFSGGGLPKITLRGVGSEIVGPGVDPGFAVHINSVFSSREGTGLRDFYDIERVEVLRGPQGTLWGRNSTGGAVNIITHRPEHAFDVSGDLEYESLEEGAEGVRARGMFNTPLIEDEAALRVAFLAYSNDGITKLNSGNTQQRVNDAETLSLRASLRWEPRIDVTVDLIGSYYRDDGAGPLPKFEGEFVSAPAVPSAGAGPGRNFDGALPNPGNPYRGTEDERSNLDSTGQTATLLVAWEPADVKVDWISGYQATNFDLHRDADGSSLPISTLDLIDRSRQVSSELLLNSTWDYPFQYTLGTNYQYEWTPKTEAFIPNAQNTADSANFVLIPSPAFVDDCDGPANCPPAKPLGVIQDDIIHALVEVENHVYGLYGNLRWEIVEDLTLGGGARYSYTHRDWDDQTRAQTFASGSPVIGSLVLQLGKEQEESWQSVTWKASADYQVTDDHLLWASTGTGARAGGFNFADEQEFEDERIFAVEGGFKSRFFDRIVLNATAFWYDWDDPQIQTTEDLLPVTVNAPSAESYGIEVELQARVTDEFLVNGSFGWLEATYDETFITSDRTEPDFAAGLNDRFPPIDIEGNRLPRSPEYTVSVGAQYTQELGGHGTITPRVDFYWRDEFSFRQYDNPKDVQSSYSRTDARITWRSPTERFWIELFGRNLEDEAVRTNLETQDSIYRLFYYDDPRTFGFRVGYDH